MDGGKVEVGVRGVRVGVGVGAGVRALLSSTRRRDTALGLWVMS